MAQRIGDVIALPSRPVCLGQAAVGGKIEGEGPLGSAFAEVFAEAKLGEENWEMAESRLQQAAIAHALRSASCQPGGIDLHFGGDLLNQCTATNFALRQLHMPLAGLYAACGTFALSLAMAALALDSGGFTRVSAAASSHFCAAEKQFRFPLEYGCEPTPTNQRTATAAGAAILGTGSEKSGQAAPRVTQIIFGRVVDMGVKDANSMGAAMAPAAWDTLRRFLAGTRTAPNDYDMILTGDLGKIGTALFKALAQKEAGLNLQGVHHDGGTLLYSTPKQDVGVGGSGIGCSAAVLCANILPRLRAGNLHRVLFLGTGALLSAISPLQGETIPSIAHGVLIESP
ncbi:MAG: stage V sporulation protein AD [Oscillospiraceae bacterium]|jgi:stage V sporulation protein AD|nr:stage V sporulation protein AD [Oscillospiraceae bacterium]